MMEIAVDHEYYGKRTAATAERSREAIVKGFESRLPSRRRGDSSMRRRSRRASSETIQTVALDDERRQASGRLHLVFLARVQEHCFACLNWRIDTVGTAHFS